MSGHVKTYLGPQNTLRPQRVSALVFHTLDLEKIPEMGM